jgi:two-component system, OmpR family, osmolarity sensor histidine kinase EnvZ
MSLSQTASDSAARAPSRFRPSRLFYLWHPFRLIKRMMPRRLFGRSLIIIVAPLIILQGIVTAVFFDRHYRIVTAIMTRGVANDVGYMVMLENRFPAGPERDRERKMAAQVFGYPAEFLPGQHLTRVVSTPATVLDRQLAFIFSSELPETATFDTRRFRNYVDLRVQLKDGVLRLLVPRERVTASNADIFVLWMIGSSLVLIAIATLFLRNQVKPIERLAHAAESFGTGRSFTGFKPHGAQEIRRAAVAFMEMRERIERFVQQRTEMLAGISHDIKTPLTRMRLQLAMMKRDRDIIAMEGDIAEMEHMLNEYLDFARGSGGEISTETDLAVLATEAVADAGRAADARHRVTLSITEPAVLSVRRNALKRCLTNLLDNALKYGKIVQLKLSRRGSRIELAVEDDGPGIEEKRREEAFRPFHRLDEGRNLQTGGVGLGLAVARDIARSHGGDIRLEDSPLGGLRAVIWLPV